jgi:parvulin-like peptidyl-prolyl isomerase
VISSGKIEQINNNFLSRWKRLPNEKELQRAIKGFATQDAYLREARSLGLDKNDSVINTQLHKKMLYLIEDMASAEEPTEQALQDYYLLHQDKYIGPAIYSFTQVYISIDRPKDELQQLLTAQQQNIQNGLVPEGDLSLLQTDFTDTTDFQLTRNLGSEFSQGLKEQPLNQWFGPIESALGLHFIYLTDHVAAKLRTLESVKQKVLVDWHYKNKKNVQEKYEQQLLEQYKLEVQMPESKGVDTIIEVKVATSKEPSQ